MNRQRIISSACLALTLAACGEDDITTVESNEDLTRVGPRVAIALIAVATGSKGHGPLDNYVLCARRGVINYYNTADNIRVAEATGCDLGDGVILDGKATVELTGGPLYPPPLRPLGVRVTSSSLTAGTTSIKAFEISDVRYTSESADIRTLKADSLRITMNGKTVQPSGATYAAVLGPPTTIDAIPNPSNSLQVLIEADLKRLAFDAGLAMAWYAVNKVRLADPGPGQTMQSSCGTSQIKWDAQLGRTYFDHNWPGCPFGGGMHIGGVFEHKLSEFSNSVLGTSMRGQIKLGGSVPTITLTQFDWSLTYGQGGQLSRFTGRIATATAERSFSFDIMLDD